VGRLRWLGAIAGAVLPSSPAFAFDGSEALFAPGLALVLLAGGAALLFQRQSRRHKLVVAERARLEVALGARDAILRAGPCAFYCWPHGSGPESFAPGGLAVLSAAAVRNWREMLDLFRREDAAALDAAVARLRAEGIDFGQNARLAANGITLDIRGQRLTRQNGQPLADLVWFADGTARDEALAERDRLRAMLDALPRPVWRRNRSDLTLTDCNRAYATAVDATREQVLSAGIELAPSSIAAEGRALAARARATGSTQSESHHIVVGGSRRLFEITETLSAGASDMVGFARDFTDLETVQAELARHIAAHAEVLENIAVAIAVYGPDTRLTFFNTAFARLWRLEEDWLATQPMMDEVLERLRERRRLPEYADFRAFRREQRAMFTSLLKPQEELLHLPDERTLRLVVSPHPFGGLTFAYEDVTDKLALERSYNTLIEVQRETLDNLYEAVAVFGSDGRLKLWNPAYAQIWQLAPDDLAGEPHVGDIIEKRRAEFYSDDDWPARKQRIIARLTSHSHYNTRVVRRDGSILQAMTVPLPDGNILLSYVDVTDSSRVENALRERNEALETAGRLKSEFIANVSYELRTPLNAIIGFAEMLSNQYFGELNTRQLGYSRDILASSHQLLQLINDILDLATIEAGYMQLETQEVDVHALMSSVLVLARERARVQNLRLDFNCPPDIGTILADERRLKQALFNLISNALKFTPGGGAVSLSARRKGDMVALVVSDTGIGVPQEDQLRIFEKFERGARQSGAGLGLSLVKSFIELHGGRVELESSPGHGTTVTCWLNVNGETPALRRAGE
jgi:signal transduction histidine kinase